MKRGVSPIIATVMLIAITVTLTGIIFVSSSGFIAQLSPPPDCSGVDFEAGIYDNQLEINNRGVKIDGFVVQLKNPSIDAIDIRDIDIKVTSAESASYAIDFQDEIMADTQVIIIPKITNAKNSIAACGDEFGEVVSVAQKESVQTS